MNFDSISNEVQFVAVRSRGPGGQNVNKVSSAALLLWPFETSSAVNEEEKLMIRQKLGNFINKENQIFLRSDEFRDLEKNKSRCLEKLHVALERAFYRPKNRRPSRPTRASKIRKLESKRRRGEVKRSRQTKWD